MIKLFVECEPPPHAIHVKPDPVRTVVTFLPLLLATPLVTPHTPLTHIPPGLVAMTSVMLPMTPLRHSTPHYVLFITPGHIKDATLY